MAKPKKSAYEYGIPGVGAHGPQQGFVTNLGTYGARKYGGGSGMTGVVRVRTNAHIAAKQAREIRRVVPLSLVQNAEDRARRIQERMRREMLMEYHTGTGRAARGVFAKVSKSKQGDRQDIVIRVTTFNYREMNFITNLGNRGYFSAQPYPIAPYRIWAKGAEERFERINSATGERRLLKSKNSILQARRDKGVGRLKVPKEGTFFTSVKGRGGVESRKLSGFPSDLTHENAQTNTGFFYPLWVDHPGFKRDVLSDIAREEGAKFVTETKEVVTFAHLEIAPGKFVSTPKGSFESSTLAVIDEIPIHSIVMSNGRFSAISAEDRIRNVSR
jgi:hypothetical protein